MTKNLVLAGLILLLVTLTQCQDHPKCFISGRCVESQLLTVLTTKNEIDCLEACRKNSQCNWFSYFSVSNFCEILANCETIDLPGERTWVSGQINCTMPECGVNGICQGHSYNAESVSNQEECLLMCKHDPQCIWFTYFSSSKMCIQYTSCATIDETCTECISGEFSCVAESTVPKGFTKLVIANGKNANTFLDTIEVIDLSPDSKVCDDLPIFPFKGFYQMGGVHNQTNPLICGGTDAASVARSECYSLKNNVWTQIQSMTVPRSTAATTLLPSEAATSSQDYLVIGGDNSAAGFLTSVEAYTSTGWQPMGSTMPEGIYESCSVTLNSTTVMLIGGHTDSQPVSSTTYIYDAVTKIWHTSAPLMIARRDLSCGIIRTEDNGDYIIVAGGIDAKNIYQTQTEILEPGLEVWREGPSLPKTLASGYIVEDIRTRSIIFVGGYVQNVGSSIELYRLSAPLTITSQWELMPQKLKTPRHWMTAFFVPDHFVNCNEAENEVATVQI